MSILDTAYKYVIGAKDSKPLPVNVQLSIDKDFKNTLFKVVGILSIGVMGGIATGIVISKTKNKR